jgi:hypothetical protein
MSSFFPGVRSVSRPEQSGTDLNLDLTKVLEEFGAFSAHAMQTLHAMADRARGQGNKVVAERREQAAQLLAGDRDSLTAELSDIDAQEAGGAPGLSRGTVSSD